MAASGFPNLRYRNPYGLPPGADPSQAVAMSNTRDPGVPGGGIYDINGDGGWPTDPWADLGVGGGGTGSPYYGTTSDKPDDSGGGNYPFASSGPMTANPNQSVDSMTAEDRALTYNRGEDLNKLAGSQLGYYGPLQQAYQGKQDQALEDLKKTPGYNDAEASKIGVDYGKNKTGDDALNSEFLSPQEQAWMVGNPYAGRDAAYTGTDAQGRALNDSEANVGAQLDAYGKQLQQKAGDYQTGVSGAVGGLKSGLHDSLSGFSKLDTAVNNPALEFDPNHTQKQFTDKDVADTETAAGVSVGNKYRTAIDDLNRAAAAEGNTSPVAIAAARQRYERASAADAGDAQTKARLDALNAQYSRAAAIEQAREAAALAQTGLKAGAATTEQAAAQKAAETGGLADVNANLTTGAKVLDANSGFGQTAVNTAMGVGKQATDVLGRMTDQQVSAQQIADKAATDRAAQIATDRQATQNNINNVRYNQGMGTDAANSQGQQTLGNARIAGQGQYRQGVQNQQTAAQQGGQKAIDQANQTYQTQTGGINTASQIKAGHEVGMLPDSGSNQARAWVGTILGSGGHEKGYVATEPEDTLIGESGPELVIEMPRYRRKMVA